MSRPRKPFGPHPPGGLMATMIRVVAAEMTDQQRLARGRRYHADDAVIDIVIGHGAVTAEVQGNRPEPYVVTIEAGGGSGVPGRREIWARCTCPDDTGTGSELCKHAVAAMFALSDEVAIEPALVDRWRASRRSAPAPEPEPDEPEQRTLAAVIPIRGPEPDPSADVLSALLRAPAGAAPPELPNLDELSHSGLPDTMVREVLTDALAHLRLRWE